MLFYRCQAICALERRHQGSLVLRLCAYCYGLLQLGFVNRIWVAASRLRWWFSAGFSPRYAARCGCRVLLQGAAAGCNGDQGGSTAIRPCLAKTTLLWPLGRLWGPSNQPHGLLYAGEEGCCGGSLGNRRETRWESSRSMTEGPKVGKILWHA